MKELTDQEKDIIRRALEAHKVSINHLIFSMRNEEFRAKFEQEKQIIEELIKRLRQC